MLAKAARFTRLQQRCEGDEISARAQELLEPQRLGAVNTPATVGSTTLRIPFPGVDELRRALLPEEVSNVDVPGDYLPVLIANGGATSQQRAFWRTCESRMMFEVYSDDLIRSVLEYLEQRAMKLSAEGKCEPPIVVLEVGAGNGLFTRALRQHQRVSSLLVFKASDINPPRDTPRESMVERLDARRALRRYSPTFVLSVWMPSGVDFTGDIRRCASCHEYLLIGVADTSVCGDVWATWGKMSQNLIEDYGLPDDAKPPFAEDGWHRKGLPLLSRMTLCRFDTVATSEGCSQVVSFRRGVEEDCPDQAGTDYPRPPRPYHMMTVDQLVAFAQTLPPL